MQKSIETHKLKCENQIVKGWYKKKKTSLEYLSKYRFTPVKSNKSNISNKSDNIDNN